MNEADLPSINLDELRLVPDWLKEETPAPSKQYASYDRPIDYDDQSRRRPPRTGSPNQGRRDSRDPRGGGDRRSAPGRPDRPMRGPQGAGRPSAPADPQQGGPWVAAAPIRVEFLPDERCMASIIKQIRTTHLAYPLFSLARMFLQEPARHYLQLSLVPGAMPPGTLLHQLGEDGPVTLDRTPLEALAFDARKESLYKEETVQKDPPKGKFTNVARERLSGTLLGPTNYHGYQLALRALFESRYSRRMSFEEYRRNIEVSSDPALVERWKEDARSSTTISTVAGDPPTVFPTMADARADFRQHHLESSLQHGMSFRLHGSVARRLPEPAVMQAIREAHERELRYPAQFVQSLRQGLQDVGLHIFKHRKRIVYVAAARPTPFVPASGAVAENISLIIETIAEHPLCTRKMLADRVLRRKQQGRTARPETIVPAAAPEATVAEVQEEVHTQTVHPEPEVTALELPAVFPTPEQGAANPPAETAKPGDELGKARAALAADVRFLVQAGHIIEFHNGTFDLPLPPKPKEEPVTKNSARPARPRDEASDVIGADPAASLSSEGAGASLPAAAPEPEDVQAPASTESLLETESPDFAATVEPPPESARTTAPEEEEVQNHVEPEETAPGIVSTVPADPAPHASAE